MAKPLTSKELAGIRQLSPNSIERSTTADDVFRLLATIEARGATNAALVEALRHGIEMLRGACMELHREANLPLSLEDSVRDPLLAPYTRTIETLQKALESATQDEPDEPDDLVLVSRKDLDAERSRTEAAFVYASRAEAEAAALRLYARHLPDCDKDELRSPGFQRGDLTFIGADTSARKVCSCGYDAVFAADILVRAGDQLHAMREVVEAARQVKPNAVFALGGYIVDNEAIDKLIAALSAHDVLVRP